MYVCQTLMASYNVHTWRVRLLQGLDERKVTVANHLVHVNVLVASL
jgi:hypothetical protein